MAQKVQIILEDDLDSGEATQTMTFRLGGATYEIDLNYKDAAKLEKALAPFIEAGRKVGKTATARGKRSSGGPSAAEVREWALANGHDVPARGRIPLVSARPTMSCTNHRKGAISPGTTQARAVRAEMPVSV